MTTIYSCANIFTISVRTYGPIAQALNLPKNVHIAPNTFERERKEQARDDERGREQDNKSLT